MITPLIVITFLSICPIFRLVQQIVVLFIHLGVTAVCYRKYKMSDPASFEHGELVRQDPLAYYVVQYRYESPWLAEILERMYPPPDRHGLFDQGRFMLHWLPDDDVPDRPAVAVMLKGFRDLEDATPEGFFTSATLTMWDWGHDHGLIKPDDPMHPRDAHFQYYIPSTMDKPTGWQAVSSYMLFAIRDLMDELDRS